LGKTTFEKSWAKSVATESVATESVATESVATESVAFWLHLCAFKMCKGGF